MKAKQRKEIAGKREINGLSVISCTTHEEARRLFTKKAPKPIDGGNSILEKFLAVMDMVTGNMASFDFNDVIRLSRPFALPVDQMRPLWELWVNTMEQLGKLDVVHGCYSDFICIYH